MTTPDEAEISVPQGFAGELITLVLAGCDPNKVTVGSLLCDASLPAKVATRFEARVVVFNSTKIPITKVSSRNCVSGVYQCS